LGYLAGGTIYGEAAMTVPKKRMPCPMGDLSEREKREREIVTASGHH
jgi:hypothetical protein